MNNELPPDPPPTQAPSVGGSRFSLKSAFLESPEALFVLGPGQRLRYANPAWERLTGQQFSRLRGTRVAARRRSASTIWQTLAPPPEVWDGEAVTVRRPALGSASGPPWWDISFFPIRGQSRVSTVLATIRVAGTPGPSPASLPAIVGEFQLKQRQQFSWESLCCDSPAGRKLESQLRHAAKSSAPLWLLGEAGTGKRTVARMLHGTGPRRNLSFVALDGRALPGYLIESLLFGHGGILKTGLIGTLYLSHLPHWPRELQERLAERLRQGGPRLPRLIIGSDQAAELLAQAQQITPLFLDGLAVLEIQIPPLRSRLGELPSIVARMLRRCSAVAEGKRVFDISPEALAVLAAYQWPSNLRELAERIVEASAQVTARGSQRIEKSDLPRFLQEKALIAGDPRPVAGPNWTLEQILEAVERRVITAALADAGGSQSEAAARLGISRARLSRRIEVLGIPMPGKIAPPASPSQGKISSETDRVQ